MADCRDALSTQEQELPGFMGLIGDHPAMRRVFELIRRVGPSGAPVLITGESGTGKELVANALHEISGRRGESLVPVHCGAIPEELLESELFGHVKGAFTGAIAARTGRFRLAHGGTIFLDEIGEMSPRFQVKLLRVLEDGSFEPVGSTASQKVDVRVIAATHRDLRSAATNGTFREDLLYRLDVVAIHLPALRERREDIPSIAEYFLRRLHAKKGLPRFVLSPEIAAALMAYDWPGNVRELRNVLERAVLLSESNGVLRPSDLPAPLAGCAATQHVVAQAPSPTVAAAAAPAVAASTAPATPWPWDFGPEGTDFYLELESFERRMIGRALELAGGSKREAARLLQVNRTTLLEKLKRRGWDFDEPRAAQAVKPVEADCESRVPVGVCAPLIANPLASGAVATAAQRWTERRPPAVYRPLEAQPFEGQPKRALA
jgi:DNA-binding NtrC family response regulator